MMNIEKTNHYKLGELSLVELDFSVSEKKDIVFHSHKNRVDLILNSAKSIEENLESTNSENKLINIENFFQKEIQKRLNDLNTEEIFDKNYKQYIHKELILAYKTINKIIKNCILSAKSVNESRLLKDILIKYNNDYCEFLYKINDLENIDDAFRENKEIIERQLHITQDSQETIFLRKKIIEIHQNFVNYMYSIGKLDVAIKEMNITIDKELTHKLGFALFEDFIGILYKIPIIDGWKKISSAKSQMIGFSKTIFNKETPEGKKEIYDAMLVLETIVETCKKVISTEYSGFYNKNGVNIYLKNGEENAINDDGEIMHGRASKNWKMSLIMFYRELFNFYIHVEQDYKGIELTQDYNDFFSKYG